MVRYRTWVGGVTGLIGWRLAGVVAWLYVVLGFRLGYACAVVHMCLLAVWCGQQGGGMRQGMLYLAVEMVGCVGAKEGVSAASSPKFDLGHGAGTKRWCRLPLSAASFHPCCLIIKSSPLCM